MLSRRFSQVFLCDVAQALMPAASALMPTPAFDTVSPPRTGVETSLDTAGTSACATSAESAFQLRSLDHSRFAGPAAGCLAPTRMAEVANALHLTLDL